MRFIFFAFLFWSSTLPAPTDIVAQNNDEKNAARLSYKSLPVLPDEIGVAGPIVGHHNGAMIVAGGANFAPPVDPNLWKLPKKYHTRGWLLSRDKASNSFAWSHQTFDLSKPIGYSSVVSTKHGVVVIGGNDDQGPTPRTFLLTYDPATNLGAVIESDLAVPDLPAASTEGGAAVIDNYLYIFAGNSTVEIKPTDSKIVPSPSRAIWRLHLDAIKERLEFLPAAKEKTPKTIDETRFEHQWARIPDLPIETSTRVLPLVVAQHDGFNERLYIIGGRRFAQGTDTTDLNNLKFFRDAWSFNPAKYDAEKFDPASGKYDGPSPWEKQADSPTPLSAGTAVAFGPGHILVLGYADGTVIQQFLKAKSAANKNGDTDYDWKDFDHPGFPKTAYAYHTITDTWTEFGMIPANQVTTPAVRVDNDIFIVSGEIQPRVRTNKVWRITVPEKKSIFGFINMAVLIGYLGLVVLVGVFFTFKNKSTDDYFRGGKHIHWFVAGCSIYATMLSSITYMAVPAKAFAQDWVYAFGLLMILAVAPIAIYVALPFFRRIDATSAYEYLEKRFNRTVRRIGSASFTIFHVFRMGVVMALAALALSSVTPFTPAQCVIIMGVLSIIYCTLGGIEAVVWTDTVQTFVLLGGALLCLAFAFAGSSSGSFSAAADAGKFHLVNFDLNPAHFTTMTILVVIVGGFGQNIASYTADQAVVQRYMTTADTKRAARSIWFNGLMAVPSAIIFFGLGTAFWMFYRSNPDKLDPAIAADRIMPLFISQELPIGLAGLVVAGIFAAAQSTVSTSMNSGATTIVTDFLRPSNIFGNVDESKREKKYLRAAQFITLIMGILGTLTGLLFVNPAIKSLFDEFIGILGLFLGVLAGLFVLGATTRRANGWGGIIGATFSLFVMSLIFLGSKNAVIFGIQFQPLAEKIIPFRLVQLNGYMYAFAGIIVCYVTGYLASLAIPVKQKQLAGLTLWSRR
jgi:SSS family transporter